MRLFFCYLRETAIRQVNCSHETYGIGIGRRSYVAKNFVLAQIDHQGRVDAFGGRSEERKTPHIDFYFRPKSVRKSLTRLCHTFAHSFGRE